MKKSLLKAGEHYAWRPHRYANPTEVVLEDLLDDRPHYVKITRQGRTRAAGTDIVTSRSLIHSWDHELKLRVQAIAAEKAAEEARDRQRAVEIAPYESLLQALEAANETLGIDAFDMKFIRTRWASGNLRLLQQEIEKLESEEVPVPSYDYKLAGTFPYAHVILLAKKVRKLEEEVMRFQMDNMRLRYGSEQGPA